MMKLVRALTLVITLLAFDQAVAQQRFTELVGSVSTQPVKASSPLSVPFITWGGDVATFYVRHNINTNLASVYWTFVCISSSSWNTSLRIIAHI